MLLPPSAGPLSERTIRTLSGHRPAAVTARDVRGCDPFHDRDLHLALWLLYELHYQGFDDVDDELEWDPDTLRMRRTLEHHFLAGLRREVPVPAGPDVVQRLREVEAADSGPSVAEFLRRHADLAQFREFVTHRSVYHLKEADPHTFAIPRLHGRAKAAFVEIQADEYGGGRHLRMHSTLFADLVRELGLDETYGRYVAHVPGITLATNNLMSLFGLHRSLRAAAAGHLTMFEMTSSAPNRRYGQALRRLGGSDAACRFFDEHVEADAVHEQIAVHELCGQLVHEQPDLADEVVFGAACGAHLDRLFAEHVVGAWSAAGSSLVRPRERAAA